MYDLSKLFDNLVAVSQGDVKRLSSATQQFANDIVEASQMPSLPSDVARPAAEPRSDAYQPPASSSN